MESRSSSQGGTPPEKPSGDSGSALSGSGGAPSGNVPSNGQGSAPGGGGNASVSYSAATTLDANTTVSDASYTSSSDAENALLVKDATVVLNNPTVSKTGDADGDNADFYGTNAAILAYNGANLTINGGNIETNGAHANAVFAYGTGEVNISNAKITTTSNNSGGIMVTGGGTLTANSLTVETSGNSAAAIRSDRGGGTMTISGGTYTSHGTGSPAIYSTADITVSDATLNSTTSEGVVIEGLNSVTLKNTVVTDNNTTNNGHSETHKNIFIYQSMSGDAEEGTGAFTAENSTFTTNSGDHFFITNTTAKITLKSNLFIQNDTSGAFLRAQTGYWGNSGSNGGKVTLDATDQDIIGDIIIDSISSIDMSLSHSYFKGTFSGEGTKTLTVSADSIVVLTGDSYVTTLNNATSDNLNIYANGYKLYVDGKEVSINQEAAPESFLSGLGANTEEVVTTATVEENTAETSSPWPILGAVGTGVLGGAIIAGILVFCYRKRCKRTKSPENNAQIDEQ